MARYSGASCRICRREGLRLFLKGDRCYTGKCAVARERLIPGQHGAKKKKLSEYGVQLREKQKTKAFYGVLEGQFRKYFEMASLKKGVTGETLLQILESRLDNTVYRSGFADSRAQARIAVGHGHFEVNGKKVNIPSYLIKAGDVITVKESHKEEPFFKNVIETKAKSNVPSWLNVEREKLSAKVIQLPSREDIDLPVQEQLIVELYSK